MIGSNRTTNEENYLLSKFARVVLKTNNLDHHRTADFPALASALRGKKNATSSMADVFTAPAILLIGNDPTEQHPLLAWQIRNNVRLHRARLYVINSNSIKLRRQATSFTEIPAGTEAQVAAFLAGNDSAADALVTSSEQQGILGRPARATARRAKAGDHFERRNSRRRSRQPCRFRLQHRWRKVYLPRRLRQFARCRRHGPLSRSPPGLSLHQRQHGFSSGMGRHPRHSRPRSGGNGEVPEKPER